MVLKVRRRSAAFCFGSLDCEYSKVTAQRPATITPGIGIARDMRSPFQLHLFHLVLWQRDGKHYRQRYTDSDRDTHAPGQAWSPDLLDIRIRYGCHVLGLGICNLK